MSLLPQTRTDPLSSWRGMGVQHHQLSSSHSQLTSWPTPLTALCKLCSSYPQIMSPESSIPLPVNNATANAASDLLRRLNPKDVKQNVDHLISLNEDLTEDLLESVDIPLAVKKCSKTKRDFLCCDYNRDGDSWRSPWSNEFEPPIEEGEGVTPSDRIRKMEIKANEAFDVYREL